MNEAEMESRFRVRVLDILFFRMEPESFLRHLLKSDCPPNRQFLHDRFIAKAEDFLIEYSRDELENAFNYAFRYFEDNVPYDFSVYFPPFYHLAEFGTSILHMCGDVPVCYFDGIMNWRDCYLHLGQDSIITAWMASPAFNNPPRSFAWPAVILGDDSDLNNITRNLSENHMHLYAGASTFSLTWCYLMNETADAVSSNNLPNTFLQPHSYRGDYDAILPMRQRLLLASFIRYTLFKKLHGIQNEDCSVLDSLRSFYFSSDVDRIKSVQRATRGLKQLYGLRFSQPNGGSVCLDYAFTSELENDSEKDFRLLASERYFLYCCFKACYCGFFNMEEQWIFYCYLLFKAQIRGEYVQVNQRIGFYNFRSYEERKFSVWKNNDAYWNEDYRQALNAAFNDQNIISLEGRISPNDTPEKDLNDIFRIDKAKLFYDQGYDSVRQWHCNNFTSNLAQDEPYYFVLHFPKRDDKISATAKPYCRHEKFRGELRRQAIALARALSNSDYYCDRVLGIDACANEIGCRPEVFAPTFRFLRDFPVEQYRKYFSARGNPCLKFTFHVGEDFLDIADGLRAIDEAIAFLNLREGDRLGHALALGVCPEAYYNFKHRQIFLSKQDLLDNLVWVLVRSNTLNIQINQTLRDEIKSKAMLLFEEIYGLQIDGFTDLLYYNSMFLRGDSPVCYKEMCFSPCPELNDPYDLFLARDTLQFPGIMDNCRNDRDVVFLYWMYHYSNIVKQNGLKKTRYTISQQYIDLMKQMQRAMQNYVASCGLAVECNPSSNVLIGTFRDYQKHPLLRFNHNGLFFDRSDPSLNVSINSDDPGVFDTSLTFEYDLMAAALTQMQNSYGSRIFTDEQIREYLKNIIEMGKGQSFLKK